jgi:HSP20 family molecular chaperone IbpA
MRATELATKTGSERREAVRQMPSIPTVIPAVDVYENDHEILLYADMPGLTKEDINVNIDNGKMTLNGIRRVETTGTSNWEEFGSVEYIRNFSVPQSIDVSKVNAELKDGVLKLHLPKSEAAKPRQIEITEA